MMTGGVLETANPEKVFDAARNRHVHFPVGGMLCLSCNRWRPVSSRTPAIQLRSMASGGSPCGDPICFECFSRHEGPFTGDPNVPGALRYTIVTLPEKRRVRWCAVA